VRCYWWARLTFLFRRLLLRMNGACWPSRRLPLDLGALSRGVACITVSPPALRDGIQTFSRANYTILRHDDYITKWLLPFCCSVLFPPAVLPLDALLRPSRTAPLLPPPYPHYCLSACIPCSRGDGAACGSGTDFVRMTARCYGRRLRRQRVARGRVHNAADATFAVLSFLSPAPSGRRGIVPFSADMPLFPAICLRALSLGFRLALPPPWRLLHLLSAPLRTLFACHYALRPTLPILSVKFCGHSARRSCGCSSSSAIMPTYLKNTAQALLPSRYAVLGIQRGRRGTAVCRRTRTGKTLSCSPPRKTHHYAAFVLPRMAPGRRR